MRIRFTSLKVSAGMLFISFMMPLAMSGQEIKPFSSQDSLKHTFSKGQFLYDEKSDAPGIYNELPGQDGLIGTTGGYSATRLGLAEKYGMILTTDRSSLSGGEFSVSGVIKEFKDGILWGAGGQDNILSVGTFNDANLAYSHYLGNRVTFTVNLNAAKFRSSHFSNHFLGGGVLFSYKLRENITLNAFGSYSIGRYYNLSDYGFSFSVDMTKRFGVDLGMQRFYDPFQKNWNTVPIVAPYYKFNKVTIGMDFGGIMQEVVRSLID